MINFSTFHFPWFIYDVARVIRRFCNPDVSVESFLATELWFLWLMLLRSEFMDAEATRKVFPLSRAFALDLAAISVPTQQQSTFKTLFLAWRKLFSFISTRESEALSVFYWHWIISSFFCTGKHFLRKQSFWLFMTGALTFWSRLWIFAVLAFYVSLSLAVEMGSSRG